MGKYNGFTLIELMLTVAIIGILASVAGPAYTDFVKKSRRSDATSALVAISMSMEKWRAVNTAYTTTLSDVGFGGGTSTDGYYTLAITSTDTKYNYVVTATATGVQAGDTSCGTISLDQNGPVVGTAAERKCWNR